MPQELPPRAPLPDVAPDLGAVDLSDPDSVASPVLARLADAIDASNRIQAQIVDLVAQAANEQAAEDTHAIPLELWLANTGRQIRSDRRMLQTAAQTLAGMPEVKDAWRQGRLSWGQVRIIVLEVAPLGRQLQATVDQAIAEELSAYANAEPDELTDRIGWLVAMLIDDSTPTTNVDLTPGGTEYLALEPRLDGSGGRGTFDLGSLNFALVSEMVDTGLEKPKATGGKAIGSEDRGNSRRTARTRAQHRAKRLIEIAHHVLGGCATDPSTSRASAPMLTLTWDVESLLGMRNAPARLITTLTGGNCKVDANTARTLVNQHGATLRSVIIDEVGNALGVGRKNYVAPGWLADTLKLQWPTCAGPCCRVSGRIGDNDHQQLWANGGPTNLTNLHRLCRSTHTGKDAWTLTTLPDGTRRWCHKRTNYRVDAIPHTRRLRPPR